jgi:hypothetical protein
MKQEAQFIDQEILELPELIEDFTPHTQPDAPASSVTSSEALIADAQEELARLYDATEKSEASAAYGISSGIPPEKILNVPKVLVEKNSNDWMRRVFAAGALALAGLGFAPPAVADAEFSQQVAAVQAKEARIHKEVSPEILEQRVKVYVGGLGMLAKIGLVKDIKTHANDIRSLLAQDDLSGGTELLASSSAILRPILKIYLDGLTELKNGERSVTKEKLASMVDAVETKSLSELQRYF